MVRWFFLLFYVGFSTVQSAQADTVKLTSLLWPPYAGYQLVQEGASVAVARAAFAQMDQQLIVDF
ncbi:MAG: ABC transporter, partial [Shewanella sp.]